MTNSARGHVSRKQYADLRHPRRRKLGQVAAKGVCEKWAAKAFLEFSFHLQQAFLDQAAG